MENIQAIKPGPKTKKDDDPLNQKVTKGSARHRFVIHSLVLYRKFALSVTFRNVV